MISSVSIPSKSETYDSSSVSTKDSEDFSSVLSILSTVSSDTTTEDSSTQTNDNSHDYQAQEKFNEKVDSLSKKASKIKSKIESGDKIDREDVEDLLESIEEISEIIDDADIVDEETVTNLMNIFSNIFEMVFNGDLLAENSATIVNPESIITDSQTIEVVDEDSTEVSAEDSKFLELLQVVEEITESFSEISEDSSVENIEKLETLFTELKQNLDSLQETDSETLTQDIKDTVDLLEKSMQVIAKASIKSDSVLVQSENIELNEVIETLKIDITEIKSDTKDLQLKLVDTSQLSSQELISDSEAMLKKLDTVLEGFQKLSLFGEESIESELKIEIEKLLEVKKQLTAIVGTAKLDVNPNGSIVNKFASEMELVVEKISTYYSKETKSISTTQTSKTSITKDAILAEHPTIDVLTISKRVTRQDIISEGKVTTQESVISTVVSTSSETLVADIDLKIEMGEKNSLPKILEQRYNDTARRNDIINQVEKAMKSSFSSMKSGESQKMVINLNPKMLGRVVIDVEMKDESLSAKFKVETDVVKELLSDSTSKLKDVLHSIGINVVDMSVDVDSKNGDTSQRAKHETQQQKRGEENAEDREEEQQRDEKRHVDSEYEIVV